MYRSIRATDTEVCRHVAYSLKVCRLFVSFYYNKKDLEPQKVIASIQSASSYESE